MKTMIALALLALPAGALAQAPSQAGGDHVGHGKAVAAAKAGAVQGADAVVKVNGLVCDFCVQALTKTFKKRAEVRDFSVNLDAKELRMAFKPGKSLDDATIKKLVTNAGYNVVGITRKVA